MNKQHVRLLILFVSISSAAISAANAESLEASDKTAVAASDEAAPDTAASEAVAPDTTVAETPEEMTGTISVMNLDSLEPSFILRNSNNREKRIGLPAGTPISLKGAPADAAQLQVGSALRIKYLSGEKGLKAVEVEITGQQVPAVSAQKKSEPKAADAGLQSEEKAPIKKHGFFR